MNNLINIILMMSAVCFFIAIYHLWIFIRRQMDVKNLSFALMAITVGLYDLFCIGLYTSTSVIEGSFWQRYQFAALSMLVPGISWFVYHLTEQRKKRYPIMITIVNILFVIAGFTIKNKLTVTPTIPHVKHFNLFGKISITYYEAEPGIIYTIQVILALICYIYIVILLIKYAKKSRNKYTKFLIVALILFYGASIHDTLLALGLIHSFYLIEFSFMIIVTAMTYLLLNTFVDLHYEVEDLNNFLEQKVAKRTRELQEARDALWGEMELAKKIQTLLIPKNPTIKDYSITGYMKTATSVGGDYYDIINTPYGDWVVIGDVSGHGVTAGLIMMMVQVSLHAVINKFNNINPADVLEVVNKVIYQNIKKFGADKYMTITVLANHSNGNFNFAGAHQDIIIYRHKTCDIELVATDGIWIGIMENTKNIIKNHQLHLEPNDVMVTYTDGIVEAWEKTKGVHEVLFGQENLQEVIKEHGNQPIEDIKKAILRALENYDSDDDITMLIIKRNV